MTHKVMKSRTRTYDAVCPSCKYSPPDGITHWPHFQQCISCSVKFTTVGQRSIESIEVLDEDIPFLQKFRYLYSRPEFNWLAGYISDLRGTLSQEWCIELFSSVVAVSLAELLNEQFDGEVIRWPAADTDQGPTPRIYVKGDS